MKKDGADTHHIVPVSIGGNDEDENKIRVNRLKHGIYHYLFNNWHPSAIIRFVFSEVLSVYFKIEVYPEEEPFKSFLDDFDNRMRQLVIQSSDKIVTEEKEKIRQININFQNKKKKQKFELALKELLDVWNHDWEGEKVIEKLCYWFKIEPPEQIIQEIKRLKKLKGQ